MGDIAEKVLDIRNAPVKKYMFFTAEDVTTADTITLSELTSIDIAYLIDRSAGSAVTFTNATNVITITGAYADIDIVGIAVGV